jgi:hypothetical protein
LNRRRNDLKVGRDVASEHAGFESFDVTSDVRFRLEEVPVVHVTVRFDMAIREYDVPFPSFDLRSEREEGRAKKRRNGRRRRGRSGLRRSKRGKNERTMRRVSHRVPDPLRRTSSGLRGMMLQREKTKG